MSQQPPQTTDRPPRADATRADDLDSLDSLDSLTDTRAVSMLRQWAEDAEKDPTRHSYFPSLARMVFRLLADEEKRRTRHTAPPVGVPDVASVTLDADDVYPVFDALLDALKAWDASDDPLEDDEARRRLDRLLRALVTMNTAYLTTLRPYIQACRDDNRAAKEWKRDRWSARVQPGRFTPAGDKERAEPTPTAGQVTP